MLLIPSITPKFDIKVFDCRETGVSSFDDVKYKFNMKYDSKINIVPKYYYSFSNIYTLMIEIINGESKESFSLYIKESFVEEVIDTINFLIV